MKRMGLYLALLVVTLCQTTQAHMTMVIRKHFFQEKDEPSFLLLYTSNFHPDLFDRQTMYVGEADVLPLGFKYDEKKKRIDTIRIFHIFKRESLTPAWYRQTVDFEGNKASFTYTTNLYRRRQHVVTLLDEQGHPNRSAKTTTLRVASDGVGIMYFHANAEDFSNFGKLIKWEKPNGEVLTSEDIQAEYQFTDQGRLRQIRTKRSLIDLDYESHKLEISRYPVARFPANSSEEGPVPIPETLIPADSIIYERSKEQAGAFLRVSALKQGKEYQDAAYYGIKRHSYVKHIYSDDVIGMAELFEPLSEPEQKAHKPHWYLPVQNGPELGQRYLNQTGKTLFDDQWQGAKGEETFPANFITYYHNTGNKEIDGKVQVKTAGGDHSTWSVFVYEESGKLKSVYRSLADSNSPPPLDEAELQGVAEQLHLSYTEKALSGWTHYAAGNFVSRTWIHTTEKDGQKTIHFERSEQEDAQPGDEQNVTGHREMLWPGLLF